MNEANMQDTSVPQPEPAVTAAKPVILKRRGAGWTKNKGHGVGKVQWRMAKLSRRRNRR